MKNTPASDESARGTRLSEPVLEPGHTVCVLSDRDVRSILQVGPVVDLMERALTEFSAGEVVNPLRTVLYAGSSQAYVGVMPAFLPSGRALGAKLVTSFGANKGRGLPSHFATIVLLDSSTGALRGVVDGRYITEVRTAAVSAVACRHLARSSIEVLSVLGAGVQARGHLEVLDAEFPLRQIRLWSPKGGVDQLVRDLARHLRAPLVRAGGAGEAVRGADVIVLATDSPEPVLDSSWVQSGALVVSVGACRPEHREIDPELLTRSWLIVDSRTAALAESGDILQSIREGRFAEDHIRGELGDVIAGRVLSRSSEGDVVVFKSMGLAVEDVATATLVCRLADERGLGQRVSL